MTFPIGGVNLAAGPTSRADLVAAWKRRARELGLATDADGIPKPLLGRRRPQALADKLWDALQGAAAGRSQPLSNRATALRTPSPPSWAPSLPPTVTPATEAELAALEALELPQSCMVCPNRRTEEQGYGTSVGWCGTCTKLTRHCPSCGEDKPQADWGAGWVERAPGVSVAAWVCPPCRADYRAREARPTFSVELGELSELVRHMLVAELVKMPGSPVGAQAMGVARLVAALRDKADPIEFDARDLDQAQRDAATVILGNVRNVAPDAARDAAERLYRAWADFAWDGEGPKAPVRRLTEAERSALRNGERPL